jgi:trehalose 6-phosphate phosphatase
VSLAAVTEVLVAHPGQGALFADFDGTLAPIVPHPPDARPEPAALDALARLARRGVLTAVLSGRPLDFLERWFGPEIRLAGLYGLEQRVDGRALTHPEAAPWLPVVAAVAAAARQELPEGVFIELKLLSLTLHTRQAPGADDAVLAFATAQSARTGLDLRAAKRSVELHPPVAVDKGTVLETWAADRSAVVYFGDDLGDLPAYAALDRLRSRGVVACGIAVGGPELPAPVRDAADVHLDSPGAAAALLDRLAPRP